MLVRVIAGAQGLPQYVSTDHDPLFEFQRWKANLRILEIEPIKTVPYVPLSHPFVERLIGTVRRELLDHVPFWSARDLERKLAAFVVYYNSARTHRSLDGQTPRISKTATWTWAGALAAALSGPVSATDSGLNKNSHPTP